MKRFFSIAIVVAVVWAVATFKSNTSPRVLLKQMDMAKVSSQEALSYRINLFGLVPVGNAEFSAPVAADYKGTGCYHLSAVAKNLDYLSSVFSAQAQIDSYVDRERLLPLMFSQKIKVQGKPEVDREVFYDQKNGVITTFKGERSIPPGTLEPLSLMQHLRRMDFNKTSEFEVTINTNQKNYTLKATASVYAKIKVGERTVSVIRVAADIRRKDKNNPYHRTKIEMFLLQNKENIPFLINVTASGIYINVRLHS